MIEKFEDCITDEQRGAFNRGGEYGIIIAASRMIYHNKSETEGDAFEAGYKAGVEIFNTRAAENPEAAMMAAIKMAKMGPED